MQRRHLLAAAAAVGLAPSIRAAEPGVSDNEIVLGHTGILSGPLGGNVKAMLGGAELAFAEARAQGTLAGRALRLVSLDDELKPDRAVANYDKLLNEQKVFAMFGCVGSATTAAAAKLLQQSGAPMVAGYAVGDSARDRVKGSAYFIRATNGREAQALVQHLTTIGITQIAVAYIDNPGGAEASRLVEAALAQHRLAPHAAAAIKGDGSNVDDAAKALADKLPQATLMYLGGTLPGQLMKACWARGTNPMFYGMSIVAGEVTVKVAGEKARGLAISQVVPYPWAEADALAREYRRLAEKSGVPVGYNSFEGYLNGLFMVEALKRCGRELNRPKLHATLRTMKLRLGGMDLDFTSGGHTGSRFIELVQVTHEGRFVR